MWVYVVTLEPGSDDADAAAVVDEFTRRRPSDTAPPESVLGGRHIAFISPVERPAFADMESFGAIETITFHREVADPDDPNFNPPYTVHPDAPFTWGGRRQRPPTRHERAFTDARDAGDVQGQLDALFEMARKGTGGKPFDTPDGES